MLFHLQMSEYQPVMKTKPKQSKEVPVSHTY